MAEAANPVDDLQAVPVTGLSDMEMRVIALARHNSERLAEWRGGRAGLAIGILLAIFGRRAAGPLANARLEALRRLAVALYHRSDRNAAAIARSLSAGLSAGDIGAVKAIVDRAMAGEAPGA